MTLVAGILLVICSGVHASDIADGSKDYGFLFKYMPLRSESSKSSTGDNGKFMAHHLNHIEHGGRSEISSDHYGLADDAFVSVGSSYTDGKSEAGGIIVPRAVDSSFTTHSDKHVHAVAHIQDTMDLTSARGGALRTSRDSDIQKTADNEEEEDVHKLFTNEDNKVIRLFAMGVAFLSCAAMVGVRMRRGMQPAIALASSGRHGIDMSIPMAKFSSEAQVKSIRDSELLHGRAATTAAFFVPTVA